MAPQTPMRPTKRSVLHVLSLWLRRDGQYWGATLLLLSLALHLAWALADGYRLLTWFHIDDAFYYFTIARNVLQGHGVTFDRLGPTNGFQPLWMLLCLVVFTLEPLGPLVPLRVLVVLVGLFHGLTGWVLYRAARKVLSSPVALALGASWTLGYAAWSTVAVGGMETSLAALALAGLWWVAVTMHREGAYTHPRHLRRLGWAMAFLVLSRLDGVFYALGFGLWWLVHAWREAGRTLSPASWWRERLALLSRWLARVLAPGLVLVGLYLAWNVFYVGSLMPVSARVKKWWGTMGASPYGSPWSGSPLLRALKGLVDPRPKVGPWAYAMYPWTRLYETVLAPRLQGYGWFQEMGRIARLAVGYAPFFLLLVGVLWATRKRWWSSVRAGVLAPWWLGALLQGGYYDAVNHLAQRFWYWYGQMMWTHAFLAFWVDAVLVRPLLSVFGKARNRRWLWEGLMLLLFAVPFFGKAWPTPAPYPVERHMYLEYARWIEAHTEPGAMVGLTGAGAMGYFVRGRNIVGLDGLVGTPQYVEALKQGRMVDYWKAHGLDYVLINKGMRLSPIYRVLEPCLQGDEWFHHDLEGWSIKLWRFVPERCP